MGIDLSSLNYEFKHKPLLVGGRAMEYYDLRKSGEDIDEERERTAITRRHYLYMQHGDIQIFSYESPDQITELMLEELKKLRLSK